MSAAERKKVENKKSMVEKEKVILGLIERGTFNIKVKDVLTYYENKTQTYSILKSNSVLYGDEDNTNSKTFYILYNDLDKDNLYYTKTDSESYNYTLPKKLSNKETRVFDDDYDKLLDELYKSLYNNHKVIMDDIKKLSKGGKRTAASAAPAYKLNGDKVHLLIDKKKLHRSVYVKGNGKAKYCKINYEFILLSKLKNKIIH